LGQVDQLSSIIVEILLGQLRMHERTLTLEGIFGDAAARPRRIRILRRLWTGTAASRAD
jgi:hypothetical protein